MRVAVGVLTMLHSICFLSPVRVKCSPEDTVGDLKKLIAAQTGTNHKKVQLKKWFVLSFRVTGSWIELTVVFPSP